MSITSANAIIMLAIPGVFPTPVQMQQFSADDVFSNDAVASNETAMGVDGILAAGFVFAPVDWTISLMADSPSNDLFDTWYQAMRQVVDTYRANGTIWLPSLNKKYDMVNGALTRYPNMANAQKTLRQRQYVIQWQSITPAPVAP